MTQSHPPFIGYSTSSTISGIAQLLLEVMPHLSLMSCPLILCCFIKGRGMIIVLISAEQVEFDGYAYFKAETTEKAFHMAGLEFGELEGRILKISNALYCLKSSGARWHGVLADALRDLGWKSCKMEPDFWYRVNGDEYEFICIWVDSILVASKRNETIHGEGRRIS